VNDARLCTEINECASSPCLNDAACAHQIDAFTCSCAPGFQGELCGGDVDECASFQCKNGATCTDLIDAYTCSCINGFEGDLCQLDSQECVSAPCRNGGACDDSASSDRIARDTYACACVEGYAGENCEIDVDECASSPCLHNAACIETTGGTTGEPSCESTNEQQTNYCLLEDDGSCTADRNDDQTQGVDSDCEHRSGANAYTCNCNPGYGGFNCYIDYDECASDPCTEHVETIAGQEVVLSAQCRQGVDQFTCICQFGYSGETCETDIDHCGSNPCSQYGVQNQCSDQVTGYDCRCLPGWTGANCEVDVDECASNPCAHGGTCNEGLDLYTCACIEGRHGENCLQMIQICDGDNLCDSEHADCNLADPEDPATYTCQCHFGYHNFGVYEDETTDANEGCTEIDECASDPCHNGAPCIDALGGYFCTCLPGYASIDCREDVDECLSNPCQNSENAACTAQPPMAADFYVCACTYGFEGMNCEVDTDECASDPCLNGGTCLDSTVTGSIGVGVFMCQCVPGLAGYMCQQDVHECASGPCENGAACSDSVSNPSISYDAYSCACTAGFANGLCVYETFGGPSAECAVAEGGSCDVDVDECQSSPCANGGQCVDSQTTLDGVQRPAVDAFACVCVAGFQGGLCEDTMDECYSAPCWNGAACTDLDAAYHCECLAGYTDVGVIEWDDDNWVVNDPSYMVGNTCEIDINECDSSPCANGGWCVDSIDAYACNCVAGFSDEHCGGEVEMCSSAEDDCDPLHAQCVVTGPGTHACDCYAGWVSVDDGKTCMDSPECDADPCLHGSCIDHTMYYTCECAAGWAGFNCAENVDECGSAPCLNSGACTDGIDSFSCACVAGFANGVTEQTCEVDINECDASPCQNGGLCADSTTATYTTTTRMAEDVSSTGDISVLVAYNTFECLCTYGYAPSGVGQVCDVDVDECASAPCENGVFHSSLPVFQF
jgi:hypothetical protein